MQQKRLVFGRMGGSIKMRSEHPQLQKEEGWSKRGELVQ